MEAHCLRLYVCWVSLERELRRKGGAERTVAAKLVHFIEWKTVARGSGRAASCVELVGQKGHGGSGK